MTAPVSSISCQAFCSSYQLDGGPFLITTPAESSLVLYYVTDVSQTLAPSFVTAQVMRFSGVVLFPYCQPDVLRPYPVTATVALFSLTVPITDFRKSFLYRGKYVRICASKYALMHHEFLPTKNLLRNVRWL